MQSLKTPSDTGILLTDSHSEDMDTGTTENLQMKAHCSCTNKM